MFIKIELWHNEWKEDHQDLEQEHQVLDQEDQESVEELENQQNQDLVLEKKYFL